MASRPDSARHEPHDRTPPAAQPDGDATFGDLLNGFPLDSHRPPHRNHHDPNEGAVPVLLGEPTDADVTPMNGTPTRIERHDADDLDDGAPSAVRAYAWTGGRTMSQFRLELETLLSTTERYHERDDSISSESHAVAALCHHPTSVAEVAALLRLPLGIAKVLAGDMAGTGLLMVHETASTNGDGPDVSLMERILSGLRRL
ncbi:MAG TPA: DUF742 domain-containing protein [Pseudonocardiaceae bacterium]|jgi:hypothetical protein|nr:DUF742 domain-containing protein [Pseudonocardiaceae bacterium]